MSEESSAIQGTRKAIKEMADGTLRIQIDIEPRDKKLFHKLFPEIDMPVAIAPLVPVAEGFCNSSQELSVYTNDPSNIPISGEIKVRRSNSSVSLFGAFAQDLRRSSFFRRPEVWRAVGSDDEFLEWLKTQDCAAPKGFGHSGDVVPAHVRRVANGSGTGVKPQYSAIPLCSEHHSLQHNNGESAIAPREWWDKKRIEYLVQWCWETLKQKLGRDSWADVPPGLLAEWARKNGVAGENDSWLPDCYRD